MEYVNRDALEHAAKVVGAVRDAVGPGVELLIEVHRRLSPMNAIRVAKMIEKYDPYWFEEPCPPDNIDAIKEVREATTIPVVTGEALYTRNDFREVLVKRAADIINPDICNTGGILELTQIAAMAQPFYVGVSPHGWNSTSIGCAAAVHASAVMPNFLIYEYAISVEPMSRDVCDGYLEPDSSYIELPKGPALAWRSTKRSWRSTHTSHSRSAPYEQWRTNAPGTKGVRIVPIRFGYVGRRA